MTGAGDYDYDDGYDLPIGCQYLDEQPSNQPSSNSTSPAAASGLAGAGVSGYVSAPASSPSSAVAATAAPVQARTEAGLVGNSFAPAPAPQTASVNATMASATQAAMLGSSATGRQGLAKMLCKPIGAAGDRPDKVFIICITVIPCSIVIFGCIIAAICDRKAR